MTSASKANGELKAFLKSLKALSEYQAELDKAGGLEKEIRRLENEIAERQRAYETIDKRLDERKAEIEKADKEGAEHRKRMEAAIEKAKDNARAVEAAAERAVQAKISHADEQLARANGAVEEANREASRIVAAAREEGVMILNQAREQGRQVQEETKRHESALVVVKSDLSAAEQQLVAVRAEIERLRRAFAS